MTRLLLTVSMAGTYFEVQNTLNWFQITSKKGQGGGEKSRFSTLAEWSRVVKVLLRFSSGFVSRERTFFVLLGVSPR